MAKPSLQLVKYLWIDEDGEEQWGYLVSLPGKGAEAVEGSAAEALIVQGRVRETRRAPGDVVTWYEMV
jgi:hypothetical protein